MECDEEGRSAHGEHCIGYKVDKQKNEMAIKDMMEGPRRDMKSVCLNVDESIGMET